MKLAVRSLLVLENVEPSRLRRDLSVYFVYLLVSWRTGKFGANEPEAVAASVGVTNPGNADCRVNAILALCHRFPMVFAADPPLRDWVVAAPTTSPAGILRVRLLAGLAQNRAGLVYAIVDLLNVFSRGGDVVHTLASVSREQPKLRTRLVQFVDCGRRRV